MPYKMDRGAMGMRFFRSLDALAIHGESKLATYLMPTEAEGELAAAARDSSLYLSRARRAHRDSPRPRYVVLSLVLLNDLPPSRYSIMI